MNYALHFAIASDHAIDKFVEGTVHRDGDAFHVWGESSATWGGHEHAVLEFEAPSHKAAVEQGTRTFLGLVVVGAADPEATCMPDRNGDPSAEEHVPFAITSAAVWSAALDLETSEPAKHTLPDWEDAWRAALA